jgi:hypothetical protein
MGIFQNNLMGAAAAAASASTDFYDHQIANSIRMSNDNDSTLKITAGTPTSNKTFTYSWWMKKYTQGNNTTQDSNVFTAGTGGGTYVFFAFTGDSNQDDATNFNFTGGGYGDTRLITNMVFKDISAWYHCVMRFDSTQSTASDRVRLYVNGVEPSYETATIHGAISQDENFSFLNASGTVQSWGGISGVGTGQEGCDVYLAEVVFCDGQSYGPDSFGETKNGVWIPKDPSGLTFGNNGYYLKFESSSDLGNDSSGNNNDLTVSGIAAHDQMLDTPTFNSSSNGGNFCTMNPLNSGSNNTFSEGNLKVTNTSGGCTALGTMSLVTGHKWYFEGKCTGSGNNWIGIIEENDYTNSANTNSSIAGSGSFNTYLYAHSGLIYYGSSSTSAGASFTTDDIIGVLVDLESSTNTIQFFKNGSAQGSAFNLTGTGINYTPMSDRGSSTGNGFWFNFGQEGTFGTGSGGGNSDVNGYGDFYYDDGASAKALCTANLPVAEEVDPAQTDDNYPQKLFSPILYTGNDTTNNITGLGFQPDLMLFKIRNTASSGMWVDSSRGRTKALYSINDNAEVTIANITAIGTDGFSLDGTSDYKANFNGNSNTYVTWCWRANGGTTSTNDSGTIDSAVQVDPSGCFSIITYTGDGSNSVFTVGHGLSAKPTFIIAKDREQTRNFSAWSQQLNGGSPADGDTLYLNTTAAETDQAGSWDVSNITSTLIGGVDGGFLNTGTNKQMFYAFTNCEGYIKSGSYEGNGNANGSFIYTGFRPAFILLKNIDGTDDWVVYDNKIGAYNEVTKALAVNIHNAEQTSNRELDILSNGFKPRTSNSNVNGSNTYIYLAMAHNPFKYATAR